jgi:hypothetical protein
MSKEQVATHVLPTYLKAMKDPIPNVRFTMIKIIQKTRSQIDASIVSSQIMPAIKEMTNDTDRDVQYYATVALNE